MPVKELTLKEKAFVKAKKQGMNNKDAAIAAGYPAKHASSHGHSVMQRPGVADALGSTLLQLGITERRIFEPIVLGLNATKTERRTTYEDGEKNTDYIEVPDIAMRLRAAAIAWKIMQDKENSENPFKPGNPNAAPAEFVDQISDMDEVELQRLIFRRDDSSEEKQ